MKKFLPRLLINVLAPLAAYEIVRPYVASDLIALLIGVTIPIVVTLVEFVVRRKIDPIGVAAILGFAILIGLLALTGGNPLILKLQEAVFTGPIGLVLLTSVLIGRPMAGLVPPLRRSMTRRQLAMLTLLVGATLVAHCAVVLGLALTLPTGEFLVVGRLSGIAVIAAGLLGARAYRGRLKRSGSTRVGS
jgi:hypothetical protein